MTRSAETTIRRTLGALGQQILNPWIAKSLEVDMGHVQLSNPEDWVDQHGDYCFRFAVLRVHDSEVAQDLVQETFVAALEARDRFAGRSAERGWLVGILKHKLIDHFRRTSRECVLDDVGQLEDDREEEVFFDQIGQW